MKLPDDFRDLLVCLSDANVDFMIVGGFAVAHHGHVRATKDIDVREYGERTLRLLGCSNHFGLFNRERRLQVWFC